MPQNLSRREFLAAGTLAAGGLMAGSPLPALAQNAPRADGTRIAEHVLECAWKDAVIDGRRVRLRAYNGTVPGPLLEMRVGETVRVTLRNRLPPYDSRAWDGDHNIPHMLDATNLHFHGLEIPPHLFEPLGTSDPLAPMVHVGPGESKEYLFRIPDDHPSGLYWYHPHHHGSTAVQAVSGMAGGIVVRGPIDEVPEIAAAAEHFLVVEDIGLFPGEADPDLWVYEPVQNSVWQTFGGNVTMWNPATRQHEPTALRGGFTTGDYAVRYMLVNGQPFFREEHNGADPTSPSGTQLDVPTITLRPGEVARIRMLNANSDNLMPMAVEGLPVHLLAFDGVNFDEVRTVAAVAPGSGESQFLLAPANRAEFLLRADRAGTFPIVQQAQSQQFLASERKVVAQVVVQGEPISPPMPLPTALPKPERHWPPIRPQDIVRRRNIVFSGAFPGVLNPGVGIDFYINEAQYDERAVPVVAELNTAEEWILSVPDSHHGGTEGHPFHIHVNSFEVVSIGGVAQPEGTIQDTIWVPANTEVVIRSRFREWTGKSVFHCHILPHEDTGMMQNFLIRRGSA